MSPENARERKQRHRYTFVIVPDVKAEKTRTMSVSRWGLIGAIIGFLLLFTVLILAVVVYTPFGQRLPISNSKLEEQYGKQIVEIQSQLHVLLQRINALRGYNLRLRRAMGETISGADSLALAALGEARAEADNESPMHPGSIEGAAGQSPAATQRYAGVAQSGAEARLQRKMQPVNFPLTQPVDGFVTREFSGDNDHFGVDFAGRPQSPVFAAADGVVVFAGWTYEDGYVLIIAHAAGYVSMYKHNQSLLRYVGETVRRGEIVALLGNTGRTSTGPHLHFEVWRDGVAENPANYLLTTQ